MTELVRRTPAVIPRDVLAFVGLSTAAFFGAGLAIALASAAAQRSLRESEHTLDPKPRPREASLVLDSDGSALFV